MFSPAAQRVQAQARLIETRAKNQDDLKKLRMSLMTLATRRWVDEAHLSRDVWHCILQCLEAEDCFKALRVCSDWHRRITCFCDFQLAKSLDNVPMYEHDDFHVDWPALEATTRPGGGEAPPRPASLGPCFWR